MKPVEVSGSKYRQRPIACKDHVSTEYEHENATVKDWKMLDSNFSI